MLTAGFADEIRMKTLITILAVTLATLTLDPASAKPLMSRPAEIEKPCIEKGDANRCYELGYRFMREKTKHSKKLARYYFQKGCSLQMQKSCSPMEAKYAARDFNQSRVIASQKGAPAPATAPVSGK